MIVGPLAYRPQRVYIGEDVFFLLRDEFATADASPLTTPRTCEPGPGTWTVSQNDGTLATSGEQLDFTAQATVTPGDLGLLKTSSISRAIGLSLLLKFNCSTFGVIGVHMIQWSSGTQTDRRHNLYITQSGITAQYSDGNGPMVHGALATSTDYEAAIILRSAGAFYLIKGGVFAEWTLLFVHKLINTTPLYPAWQNFNAVGSLDFLRVPQLAAPWDSDNGIATDVLAGARSPGDAFTHEGDCLIEFEVTTLPSSGQIEVEFRQQTANTDCWRVTIDSAGNIDLDEIVASGSTERGTSAGTIANGERVVIIANDTNITIYGNNTQLISYASASNYKTETDGELETEGTGGSVSDILSWPRVLSGSALSQLELYTS